MAKRSQIEVGQEWAYQRSRNHYIGNYGYEKVVIKSVEAYRAGYGGARKTSKGQGVLVEHSGYNNFKSEKVIQLSQLFIPWAEYEVQKAEYDAKKKVSDAAAAIVKAEREKFKAEVYNPAFNEFQNIIKAVSGKYVSGYDRVGELPIEVLQLVIEAYKVKEVA